MGAPLANDNGGLGLTGNIGYCQIGWLGGGPLINQPGVILIDTLDVMLTCSANGTGTLASIQQMTMGGNYVTVPGMVFALQNNETRCFGVKGPFIGAQILITSVTGAGLSYGSLIGSTRNA